MITTLEEETYIKYFHLEKYPVDEDDIAFVLCAINGKTTHLITYDAHLLEINDYYDFSKVIYISFINFIFRYMTVYFLIFSLQQNI